jgi:hypothetical protein
VPVIVSASLLFLSKDDTAVASRTIGDCSSCAAADWKTTLSSIAKSFPKTSDRLFAVLVDFR